ncbi:MAG: type I restriction-modification enzyme R subunit C-terminal domain-containing protein, partial [Arenimonas sp.]
LIDGLAERGFDRDIMAEMQRLVDAENSDLFDVLAHIAYAYEPKTREQRADNARASGFSRYSDSQRDFLDFILSHYESQGIDELASERLSKLLELKYHALQDATEKLNASPLQIRSMFVDIQRHLYTDGMN